MKYPSTKTRKNSGEQEIERQFKDKQPLPVSPPSHMQRLLFLQKYQHNLEDRVTQSGRELRLTRKPSSTDF